MAKIDVEVSSLAALQLIYSAERKPLACFIGSDEAMVTLARIRRLVGDQVTVPLAFPAFNPKNGKAATNNLFDDSQEFSILVCSPALLAALEACLGRRFSTEAVNLVGVDLLDRLEQGLMPRAFAVAAECQDRHLADFSEPPSTSPSGPRRLVQRVRRRFRGS